MPSAYESIGESIVVQKEPRFSESIGVHKVPSCLGMHFACAWGSTSL